MDMMNSERFDFLAAPAPTKTKDTATAALQTGAGSGMENTENNGRTDTVAPGGSRSDDFAKILAKTTDGAPSGRKSIPDSAASAAPLAEASIAVGQARDQVEFLPDGTPAAPMNTANSAPIPDRDPRVIAASDLRTTPTAAAQNPDLNGHEKSAQSGDGRTALGNTSGHASGNVPEIAAKITPQTTQVPKSPMSLDASRLATTADGADTASTASVRNDTPVSGALAAKPDNTPALAQTSVGSDKTSLTQQASFARNPGAQPTEATPATHSGWRQGPDVPPGPVETTVMSRATPPAAENRTLAPQIMNDSPKTEAMTPKTGPLVRVQATPTPAGAALMPKPEANQLAPLASAVETAAKPAPGATELASAQRSTFATPPPLATDASMGRGFSDEVVVRQVAPAGFSRSEPPAPVAAATHGPNTTPATAAPVVTPNSDPRALIDTAATETNASPDRAAPAATAQTGTPVVATLDATANAPLSRPRGDAPVETTAPPAEAETTTAKAATAEKSDPYVTQASSTVDTSKLPLSVGQNTFSMLAENAEKERLFDAASFGDIAQLETRSTTAVTGTREMMNMTPFTMRNVATQLAQAAQGAADGPMELTLNPEELGKVRMTFATQDGVMTVSLATERPETLELMRRHIESLAQEFQEIGFEQVAFDFGQAGDQGFANDQGEGTDDGRSAENDIIATGRLSNAEDALDPGGQLPSDGLDIRI